MLTEGLELQSSKKQKVGGSEKKLTRLYMNPDKISVTAEIAKD
jgi:hypothetical protein